MGFTAVEDNADWAATAEFPYEVWSDGNRDLAAHYGAGAGDKPERVTVLLDPEGNVALEYAVGLIQGEAPENVLSDLVALQE